MTQTALFDKQASEQAKAAGMLLAAERHQDILEYARFLARELAARAQDGITADDVVRALMDRGHGVHCLGNAAGSLFRGPEEKIGPRSRPPERTQGLEAAMIQLTLPHTPEYEPWLQCCAFLLQRANSGCRSWNNCGPRESACDRFYAMKKEILLAHAHQQGFDIQHLVKKCWNCGGTGRVYAYDDETDECYRCDGTGIYQERWVLLARYNLAGHVFHCPAGYVQDPGVTPTIEGLIEHRASPHAWECFRILADGRYSLQARCTNQAAQDLITKIQFEEHHATNPGTTTCGTGH